MQDLNVLCQVCVFRGDQKNKMAPPASDWLRHFRLLLWNQWTEFNEIWQGARSQRPLPSLCFSGRSGKKDDRPGLWLAVTFLTSLMKSLNGNQRSLTGSKMTMSSTKFVFLGRSEQQDGRPGLWLAETFSTSSLKTLNGIQRNLTRCKMTMSSTKFVFFLADLKNKMAALASDRLRHFRLLLWNRWTEFNETWQEARSKRLLPSLCYWGRSQKQDGRPDLWFAETFSTSSLKSLNGIQRNLTRSKLLTSSTKILFFGPVGKKRWPPWPLVGWDIFDFFSETAERNSTKLDGKEDLNVLYQVCVFWADRKNKMAALASDWLRHFRLLLWNRWTEFNETWQEARSQRLLPSLCFWADWKNKMAAPASDWLRHFQLLIWNRWTEFDEAWQEARSQRPLPILCFSGRSVKKDCHHGPWLAETFFTSPLKLLNGIQRNLTGSKISTSSTKLCFSVWWVNKNYRPGRSVKKVAHCTQVHDMWPFGPLVYVFI